MDLVMLAVFIPACFALNMAPGPNNLLALNNGKSFGIRTAVIAGIGRLFAFLLMIALVSTGLSAVLYTSEYVFLAIKIIGACYLFYLAYQTWIANGSLKQTRQNQSLKPGSFVKYTPLMKQEFVLAAGNPKAILIFTAFLPQFISVSEPTQPQFMVLGSLFLIMEWVAIALYATAGRYLENVLSNAKSNRVFNRVCASFYASAGAGILLNEK